MWLHFLSNTLTGTLFFSFSCKLFQLFPFDSPRVHWHAPPAVPCVCLCVSLYIVKLPNGSFLCCINCLPLLPLPNIPIIVLDVFLTLHFLLVSHLFTPLNCLCHLMRPSCFIQTFIWGNGHFPVLPPRVWEVTTGEVLNTLIHHNEAVLHLRFANGLMVTCSKDRSIAVWDMASPTDISLRRVLVGHRAAVNVVDFDDKYIVSASGDRTIKVPGVTYCPEIRLEFLETPRQLIKDRLVVMGISCCAPKECSLSGTCTVKTKFFTISAL